MLDEHGVGGLSLNELARRSRLAKSNVLRYFESREAVLLELYAREHGAWLDDVDERLAGDRSGDAIGRVATAIADAAAARPRFCELCSSAPVVLERNVSAAVAVAYKRAMIAGSARLADVAAERVGPLDDAARLAFVASVTFFIGGLWASDRPSEGMAAAYATQPGLEPLPYDFATSLRVLVTTALAGVLARPPRP